MGQLYQRPTVISLFAIFHFILGALLFLAGLSGVATSLMRDWERGELLLVTFAIVGVVGLVSTVCAIGLWNLRSYGRTLLIVFSVIGLLGFPLGTLLSALMLVYLYNPGVKVLYSETHPSRWSPAEVAEVTRLSESSAVTVILISYGVLQLLILSVAFIGLIAAVALPGIFKARVSTNEEAAVGDVRTVVSAELAYASSNGGHYDRLECLAKPRECLPGYHLDGPSFLQEVPPPSRAGYRRELQVGPPARQNDIAFANLSPSSVQSFVYFAYPEEPGVTGVRSFCGDYTGFICVTMDGSRPTVVNGRCDPACTPLE